MVLSHSSTQRALPRTGRGLTCLLTPLHPERALSLARKSGVHLEARRQDLCCSVLPPNTYDVVACFYYLQRDLWPQIISTLRPGGMVVYETFTSDQPRFGPPTNPAYLLAPNELIDAFRELRIRVYRDVVVDGPKAVASLIAEKSKHA